MAFLTQGGSQIGSSNITDGAIVNADINANANIDQSKIGDSLNDNTGLVSVQVSTTGSISVTTVANQRLVVFAAGEPAGAAGMQTVSLRYNGVTKDSRGESTGATHNSFKLQYTEVPGAGTQTIDLAISGGSIANSTIIVMKFRCA